MAQQIDAFVTVGSMLKKARVEQGFCEREVATRLKLVPEYVGLLEEDAFHQLRSPAFARGYVRAYGRLLQLDNDYLMAVFDEAEPDLASVRTKRVVTRPLQLQRTGMGVMVGLGVLVLLVAALWWWRADNAVAQLPTSSMEAAVSAPQPLSFAQESEG